MHLRFLQRLQFVADQFRIRPAEQTAVAQHAAWYGQEERVSSYAAHSGHGLHASEFALLSRGYVRAGDRLLDIGCGTGREALGFAQRGVCVTGIDASHAMVARARELGAGKDARFEVMSFTALAFPQGSFDVAYLASNVYQRTPTRAARVRALQGLRRTLREGAVIALAATVSPHLSWQMRTLIERPRALVRRAFQLPLLEEGDRLWRYRGSDAPLLLHVFQSAQEIERELLDAGLVRVDHVGESLYIARTPGGAQRYRLTGSVSAAAVEDELMLADLDRGIMHRLNPTAMALWQALERGATVEEATRSLAALFSVSATSVARDACELLATLLAEGLIQVIDE